MGTLSGRIEPWGPMVHLKVMQSPQRVAALKAAGLPFAAPATVLALLDTGASGPAIDRFIAAALQLEYRGVASIHTPSTGAGYDTRNEFDACFVLGETQSDPLVLTLSVIESDFASEGFYALVGRDVLGHCVLRYDGPNDTFTLDF